MTTIKDSGKRLEIESGMRRDVTTGKTNYLLVRVGPMLKRWADQLTRGDVKYDKDRKPGEPRNWTLANGPAELERFQESAARHFEQWLAGEDDEDHAAAVFFNINGAEYVKQKMGEPEWVHNELLWLAKDIFSEPVDTRPDLSEGFPGVLSEQEAQFRADPYTVTAEKVGACGCHDHCPCSTPPLTCRVPGYLGEPACESCAARGYCGTAS